MELPGGDNDLRYEVMYFLEAPDHTIGAFKEVWAGLGDSIVVVGARACGTATSTPTTWVAPSRPPSTRRPRDIRVTDLSDQIDEERWVREGASTLATPTARSAPPRTA